MMFLSHSLLIFRSDFKRKFPITNCYKLFIKWFQYQMFHEHFSICKSILGCFRKHLSFLCPAFSHSLLLRDWKKLLNRNDLYLLLELTLEENCIIPKRNRIYFHLHFCILFFFFFLSFTSMTDSLTRATDNKRLPLGKITIRFML